MKNRKMNWKGVALAAVMMGLTLGSTADALANGSKGSVKWKSGSGVMVQWKGTWYKATVVAAKNNKFKVHYDGWSNTWDERVGAARIKKRS